MTTRAGPRATRLLVAYDGSESAATAIAVAGALFRDASATVTSVYAHEPILETTGLESADAPAAAGAMAAAGRDLAASAGLRAEARADAGRTAWRTLCATAERIDADVIVCGTDGRRSVRRIALGSTATSLLHNAGRPLLVTPAASPQLDGPLVAAYDGSEGARSALRFAAAHLTPRKLVVAAVQRPAHSGAADAAAEGAELARSLGLDASGEAIEQGGPAWRALVDVARTRRAVAVLAGSRGRGAAAATLLGSVTTGLVQAAAVPVLVVPPAGPQRQSSGSAAQISEPKNGL